MQTTSSTSPGINTHPDRVISAFCPGHISGYFRRVDGTDPATTGSVGAGLVITEGVLSRVTPADRTTITVLRTVPDGKTIRIAGDSPLIRTALGKTGMTANVVTWCRLPIGAGFGLSAAALLSTLTALDRAYSLGMGERRIAHLAHETEVERRTGLGDVVSCRGGGMVVRTIAGIDAPVRRFTGLSERIYAISFGPIHTPSVLGSPERMAKVSAAFPAGEPATPREFFLMARAFAEKSGLVTDRVREVFSACDAAGISASMTMLGDGVFACGEDARPVLGRFGEVYEMGIAGSGPAVVEGS